MYSSTSSLDWYSLSYSRWLVAFCSVMVSHFSSAMVNVLFWFGSRTKDVPAIPGLFSCRKVFVASKVLFPHTHTRFFGISFQFECLDVTLQQDQNCKDNLFVNCSTRPLILQTLKKVSTVKLLVNKKL